MPKRAFGVLIALALLGVLASAALGARSQPRVTARAAVQPVRWALGAANYLETSAGGVLGRASLDCVKAVATQDWRRVEGENRTLRDYLLAAEPARLSLVVQAKAAARLLRPYVRGTRVAHLAAAKTRLLASATAYGASFEAMRDGADALDAHDCLAARSSWTTAGQRAINGQDDARDGLLELRAAGFRFVDPDWAYE
jgi:hypothetical protein